jgi:hypothetical protein
MNKCGYRIDMAAAARAERTARSASPASRGAAQAATPCPARPRRPGHIRYRQSPPPSELPPMGTGIRCTNQRGGAAAAGRGGGRGAATAGWGGAARARGGGAAAAMVAKVPCSLTPRHPPRPPWDKILDKGSPEILALKWSITVFHLHLESRAVRKIRLR